MTDDLDYGDHYAIRRLKYFRNRSLSNPKYGDSTFTRKFLSRPGRWTFDSPLGPLRLAAEKHLDTYDLAVKRHDGQGALVAWQEMLGAIDVLIAEAERIEGHRLWPTS
jgi:hypothetical protein